MLRLVKAQAMIEYLIYFSITLLIFAGLFAFIFIYQDSEVNDVKNIALTQEATKIQHLIQTFALMNPTFTQTVSITETINGEEFDFEILASNLYITQNEREIILPLPEINGNTTNKTFQIQVREGGIFIT